jgi:hypothetical protein
MPNDVLIDNVLSPAASATPSERLVLKIAAALIKQIDQDYEVREDTDERIKVNTEEMGWIPDAFEVWNSIVRPKRWAIPERMEAVRREEAEIQEVMDQTGLDYFEAGNEYLRRRKKKS